MTWSVVLKRVTKMYKGTEVKIKNELCLIVKDTSVTSMAFNAVGFRFPVELIKKSIANE